MKLHIGKMRPFLFITSLAPSLGPPIPMKKSKYDIAFSYLHSLLNILLYEDLKQIKEKSHVYFLASFNFRLQYDNHETSTAHRCFIATKLH